METRFEIYLQRPTKLFDITYPTFYQWWHWATNAEQTKAVKAACKGETPSLNVRGVDEFEELQTCVEDRINVVSDFSDKLVGLDNSLDLQHAVYNTIIYYIAISTVVLPQ